MISARDLLFELVATPSVSGDERAVSELLVQRMSELGFDAHTDGAGNAVGVRRGPDAADGRTRELCLLGHMDTVPGEIPVRVEGDVLHGRGSVDAKGPLAAFVLAVAGVEPAPGVTLTVIGAVEEELPTSKGARHVAPTRRPEACIIGEPSSWTGVTLGYKGSLNLDLEIVQPCGHGAGPQGACAERAVGVWNGLAGYAEHFNASRERLFDRLMPSIKSLATESDGLHDTVRATFGFRLPPDFDPRELEALARQVDGDSEQRWYGHEPAWSSPRTSPLARAFARSLASLDERPRFKHKTGTSDMNVLGPVWGCPIVAYGPGDSLLDHTPEECLSLDELDRSIEVLKGVLIEGGYAVGLPA